jgi:hypothetical protein
MKYMLFICAEGLPGPDELAVLQRECPGWVEEMDGRGVRLLGRELDLPEATTTVRVRDGGTLLTDGPFAETKEFMAGFDVLECADLDEAIEVAAKHPSCWFQTIEIRPFADGLAVGEAASAFGRSEDGSGEPYLLAAWTGAGPVGDQDAVDESEAWRRDLETRGVQVLGSALKGPEAATTIRVRNGETLLGDGPFTGDREFIGDIDVVNCPSREHAIELAAAHPLARYHAIEVRPFATE